MRVLVTGATGFIGPYVVDRLLQLGHNVRALIRPHTRAQPLRVQSLEDHGAELVIGDLANYASLQKAVRSIDSVCHLALSYSKRTPLHRSLIAINSLHTENLLRAIVSAGIRRLVLSGSVAVYGWPQLVPSMWPLAEVTPPVGVGIYPRVKLQTETLVRRYHVHGLEYVILRLPNVYGPKISRFERVIRRILRNPIRSLSPNYSMGLVLESSWYSHWVHLLDAAEAIAVAATIGGQFADVFNVAGNEAVPRNQLVALINEIARNDEWHLSAGRYQLPLSTVRIYDVQKAKQFLKFEPKISLREGLREVIRAMHDKRPGVGVFID
jgi:nucleoside-diphosphate-sugar epimerase